MRLRHALVGFPPVALLCSAVAVAWGAAPPASRTEALDVVNDVARVRTALMATCPAGTPLDAALALLRGRGLTCATSEPPLSNLTWRQIECSTPPSPGGTSLQIDVAGRNGMVADIGVEDQSCVSRADVTDPTPAAVDCDISSKRLLQIEARRRAAVGALLTDVLGTPAQKLRR